MTLIPPKLDRVEILQYEVNASWWASWIGWKWGQALAASYFAWKVRRKMARYDDMRAMASRVSNRKRGRPLWLTREE